MQAVLYSALICVVLGILDAAPSALSPPEHCCAPDQMECQVSQSMAYVKDGVPGLTLVSGAISVDYPLKKMANFAVGDRNGQAFNTTVIGDYGTGDMWVVDELQQTCTHGRMPPGDMTSQCIPSDATYINTVTFGLGTTFDGDSWLVNIHDEEADTFVDVFFVMTSDTCAPLTETVKGTMGDLDLYVSMLYYNTKDSISDPSVFDVPEICLEEGVATMGKMPQSPLQSFLVHRMGINHLPSTMM